MAHHHGAVAQPLTPPHLVLQVLPEAHALGVHTRPAEEQPCAADEVCQCLICDDTLLDRLTQGHRLGLLLITWGPAEVTAVAAMAAAVEAAAVAAMAPAAVVAVVAVLAAAVKASIVAAIGQVQAEGSNILW